jgi:hypothetical protein
MFVRVPLEKQLPLYVATVQGKQQQGGQVTKRVRARTARAMATAMRVVGDKEGKSSKGNGDGDQGGKQATATATKRAMAMVTRVVGAHGQQQQRGQW